MPLKSPPEQSPLAVKLIEQLRNSKEREHQAVASLMDTRLEWYAFEAMKLAQADGFNTAEILSAYIGFEGGNIFSLIKLQKDPDLEALLIMLAVTELQLVAKKLMDELK
jgi:hypothetical protein